MKRSMRRAATAAAATVAFGLMAAVPAQAGSLYLYADQFYGSWIGTFTTKMTKVHNISNTNDNKLSSFKNKSNYDVAFYHGSDGKGSCFTGDANSEAAFFWPADDNKVSSFFLGKRCGA